MSLIITFLCEARLDDGDGCGQRIRIPGRRTLEDARAEAYEYGWVQRGGHDMCPTHANRGRT